MARFREGIESLSDLKPGLVLEGVVTNVAAFGAFVDIGVHQDGLVHVSAMAGTFVRDPHTVLKPGQIVTVKVLEVDLKRQRISLSMRLDEAASRPPASAPSGSASPRPNTHTEGTPRPASGARSPQPLSAMALALEKAKRKS